MVVETVGLVPFLDGTQLLYGEVGDLGPRGWSSHRCEAQHAEGLRWVSTEPERRDGARPPLPSATGEDPRDLLDGILERIQLREGILVRAGTGHPAEEDKALTARGLNRNFQFVGEDLSVQLPHAGECCLGVQGRGRDR